jgi:hypothetical protein
MPDFDSFDDAVDHLSAVTAIAEPDEELLDAANFVFRFGTLGEHFEQQDLRNAQTWSGPPGAAWALIGHWSVQRHDPAWSGGRDFAAHAQGCDVCVILEDALVERALIVGHELDMVCEDCGGGLTAHAIVIGSFRRGEVVCVGQWERTEPAAVGNGPGTFVDQASQSAYSASWWAPLSDGTFAVVCRAYYLVLKNGQVWLVREDEYIICSDPAALDGSGIASTAVLVQLESDSPLGEDLAQLATDSFPPDPGEWQEHVGSVHFAVPATVAA